MASLPSGKAVAFSSPLPLADSPVAGHCEDCACPVSYADVQYAHGNSQQDVSPDTDAASSWTRNSDAVEIQLDDAHWALFNPLGSGGVTVVNHVAYRIFRLIGRRTTLAEIVPGWIRARNEAIGVIRHLAERGLVQAD